jgi:hypothetical protein
METTFKILWRDLGCPIETWSYHFAEKLIRVRRHHIDAAAGNPEAVCTVVCADPLSDDPKYGIGLIDSEP